LIWSLVETIHYNWEFPDCGFARNDMTQIVFPQDDGEPVTVDLRNPYLAALLAWLLPGAGHFYQRRRAKGALFCICVLSTFLFGLGLGRGRVVYASFDKNDFRWQFVPQLACGAVTFPAIAQKAIVQQGGDRMWVLCERFSGDHPNGELRFAKITPENQDQKTNEVTLKDGFMAPPDGPKFLQGNDVLARWHFDYRHDFEMGTLFTIVAGLLNIMAIYDAFVGPAIITRAQKNRLEGEPEGS